MKRWIVGVDPRRRHGAASGCTVVDVAQLSAGQPEGPRQRHAGLRAGARLSHRAAQADRPRPEHVGHRRRGLPAGDLRRDERRRGDPRHRPGRPVRRRRRALRPPRRLLQRRRLQPGHDLQRRDRQRDGRGGDAGDRPRDRRPVDQAAALGGPRVLGPRGGRAGRLGHYVQNPLVPLAQTVGYVNFDIQGANVLPSLRDTTFAVGAETRRRAPAGDRRARDRRASLDTRAELDLRPEPQRLRQLHQPQRAHRLLHRRDGPLLPHRRRRDRASSTSTSSTSRSPRRWRRSRELASTASPPAFVAGHAAGDLRRRGRRPSAVINRAYADLRPLLGRRPAGADPDQGRRPTPRRRGPGGVRLRRRRACCSSDAARFVEILSHGTCSGFLDASAQRAHRAVPARARRRALAVTSARRTRAGCRAA